MNPRERQILTPPTRDVAPDTKPEIREQISRKYTPYRPPSQLPDRIVSPDWTLRWCRFRLKAGVDDPGNMSKHRRDGYEPVPYASRAEVLVEPDSVSPCASGNIEIGDLMLCRRATAISLARREHYQDLTKKQIRGAINKVKDQEHERYPGTIFDNSTHSFQRAPLREVEFSGE